MHLQSVKAEFSMLEPQLVHVSKIVSDELQQIDSKEILLHEQFHEQNDEYKKVRIFRTHGVLTNILHYFTHNA